jgi:hypothetical protein
MMDILIGNASTDEVLLAMLHWKSLEQSLLNLHSYSGRHLVVISSSLHAFT